MKLGSFPVLLFVACGLFPATVRAQMVCCDMDELSDSISRTLKPAVTVTANAGLAGDSKYNAGPGMMVGTQISLLRFGRLRLPTVGIEAGLLDYCPPDHVENGTGPDGSCRYVGALQLTTGLELTLHKPEKGQQGELTLVGGVARVVLGPLSGCWGARGGLAFRF